MKRRRDVARFRSGGQKRFRDRAGLQRSESDPRGNLFQHAKQSSQIGIAVAVRGNVDPRKHDLPRAAGNRFPQNAFRAARARPAAQIGDQTIGAETVATVLNPQKRARLVALGDRQFAKDVFLGEHRAALRKQIENPVLAHRTGDERDSLAGFERSGTVLGGATAHDDGRGGIELSHPRNRLTALVFRLRRDGAGVDQIQIGITEFVRRLEPAFFEPAHERRALNLVHFTAEGKHARLHCSSPARYAVTDKNAIAAVSARRIRLPREIPANPAALAQANSSSVNPPSLPTTSA